MKEGCPFCEYDGPSEILYGGAAAFVIEPIDPVVPGHVLVVPFFHAVDWTVSETVSTAVVAVAVRYAQRNPGYDECNLIASKGAAATQTVEHLHMHIVPRRDGDELALPWS